MKSLIVFVLLLSFKVSAQTDSLVRWKELEFTTPYESATFENHFKKGNTDFVALFFANSPTATQDVKNFEERFRATLKEIQTS